MLRIMTGNISRQFGRGLFRCFPGHAFVLFKTERFFVSDSDVICHGDVDHFLPEYEKLLAQIAKTREQLKVQLEKAMER